MNILSNEGGYKIHSKNSVAFLFNKMNTLSKKLGKSTAEVASKVTRNKLN
jgi:hypothetical protein